MEKKIFTLMLAAVVGTAAMAQDFKYEPDAKIPVNKDVTIGKLDNGLTYYIRKNALPENKSELYLIVNAGSILETDAQQGLAHFLEHMCFNGTRNFPKNELIKTLESLGVRFGHDLNAYTSFDETVYKLPIPSDKLDTGFRVLEDWAFNLLLTDEDIDSERGIILEELRLGKGAGDRMRQKWFPVIFYGSKYPERMPIGKEEILKTFKPDEIRKFYKDWYRPNNMAVIAVGDFDPAYVEKEIRERFGKVQNPANAPVRTSSSVASHKDAKVIVTTDKEMTNTVVQLLIKRPETADVVQKDYVEGIKKALFSVMLSDRFNEMSQKPDAPFMYAAAYIGNQLRPVDAYTALAISAPGASFAAYKALLTEMERAEEFGFTDSELERAKAQLLASLEKSYNDRDKALSESHVGELQRNFLVQESIPGIEYEYNLTNAVLPLINAGDINALTKQYSSDDSFAAVIMGPEGQSYPSEAEMLSAFTEVKAADLKPYDDGMAVRQLMEKEPAAGSVVSEKTYTKSGVTEWKLSNGATVVLKPTDFKNDDIQFNAYSHGGRSLEPAAYDYSTVSATGILNQSGLNGIKASDLGKLMAGKTVRVRPLIQNYREGMVGSFVPKDTKDAFQMIYLYFTAPFFDQEAFQVYIKNGKANYANFLDSPNNYYSYNMNKALYGDSQRNAIFSKPSDFDRVSLKDAEAAYKSRFANAADFVFTFVGSFTPEQIKPFVEQYIASLPADKKKKEKAVDMGLNYAAAPQELTFNKGVDDKSMVSMYFSKPVKISEKFVQDFRGFNEILSMRTLMALREEMSGVYGVGASGSTVRTPKEEAFFIIRFGSNTEAYNELYERALLELKKLQNEGPNADEVAALKEKFRVQLEQNIKKNDYWVQGLSNAYMNGESPETMLDYGKYIEQYNAKDIQAAGKKAVDADKYLRFILLPEKAE